MRTCTPRGVHVACVILFSFFYLAFVPESVSCRFAVEIQGTLRFGTLDGTESTTQTQSRACRQAKEKYQAGETSSQKEVEERASKSGLARLAGSGHGTTRHPGHCMGVGGRVRSEAVENPQSPHFAKRLSSERPGS